MKAQKRIVLAGIGIASMIIVGCLGCKKSNDGPDCSLAANKKIQFVYPAGGETFYVGHPVTIQWKVDAQYVSQSILKVTINDGLTWSSIGAGVTTVGNSGDQCESYTWTIGTGENPPLQPAATNPQCKFKVFQYQDESGTFDTTATFTISK